MTANEQLAEALRVRQLYLLRHQVSARKVIDGYIDQLGAAIAAQILKVSPSEPARGVYQRARVEKLIAAVAAQIAVTYKDINGFMLDEMAALADAEAVYTIAKVNELVGSDVAALALPAAEATALVRNVLIGGAPMADWWSKQSASIRDRFAQQMRIGIIGGETDAQLIARVRGTRAMGFKDGLMDVSRRMAKILVRGSSSAAIGAVRKKAVEDNPRVFQGIQQVSVLDGRTSQTCIAYAGKVWEVPGFKPLGHSLPYNGGTPRHPNCRSTEIPVLTEEYGGAPADDIGFDDFLNGKSAVFLDELLGKGKAGLYRGGEITLSDLVDQRGRPLTLEQLKTLS